MRKKLEDTLSLGIDGTSFDIFDCTLLKQIRKGKLRGTVNLAKEVEIAPKNLISRLKKHKEVGWIKIKTVAAKPKGREKVFEITPKGDHAIAIFEDMRSGIAKNRDVFIRELKNIR